MAKITRYNGNLVAFGSSAQGTERTIFGGTIQSDSLDDNLNSFYERGWGIVDANEFPSQEDFNAVNFTNSQLIAYLHQVGIPEWNINQEYHTGSITNKNGVIYKSLIDNNIGNDPITDTNNWKYIAGSPKVSGTATFTNTDNNINLVGIGNIGLEIGDVISISGSTNNDKYFTVEVITDADNIIVNQAHAGGTTAKALVDETAAINVELLCKWYNAPIGLGQGWVNVLSTRSESTAYQNNTNRTISIIVDSETAGGNVTGLLLYISGDLIGYQFSQVSSSFISRAQISANIPPMSDYTISLYQTSSFFKWNELR